MSNSRSDVQRLFRHFGLDPSDYVETVSVTQTASGQAGRSSGVSSALRTQAQQPADQDLFDYRNFELSF